MEGERDERLEELVQLDGEIAARDLARFAVGGGEDLRDARHREVLGDEAAVEREVDELRLLDGLRRATVVTWLGSGLGLGLGLGFGFGFG